MGIWSLSALTAAACGGVFRGLLNWRDKAPWNTRFYSINRVQDWLSVLGFRTLRRESVFYRPPVQRAGLLRRTGFLEALRYVFPHNGAVYVLKARKHTVPLTPTRWRWSSRRGLVSGGFARPHQRRGLNEWRCRQSSYLPTAPCRGNPGPGGWGAILRFGEHEKELSGAQAQTTNNRMEMMAAIQGLESLRRGWRRDPHD